MSNLKNGSSKMSEIFYKDNGGNIFKYKKYCVEGNCTKIVSYNYKDKKESLYCQDHRLKNMINIKKNHSLCEEHNESYLKECSQCKLDLVNYDKSSQYLKEQIIKNYDKKGIELFKCHLCDKLVEKDHYFSKEHIDIFNNNITISFRNSIKNKLIDIICDFHKCNKNAFYEDLYFKHKMKKLVLKHCSKDKTNKISIYKFNQSINNISEISFHYWIEKYDSNDILSDIDNIEKLNTANFDNNLKSIVVGGNEVKVTDKIVSGGDNNIDLEDINILCNQVGSGNSINIIQHTRCILKISESDLFSAGDQFENIPELFYKLKNLLIIKNNDKKCFLYCYIRKFKNCLSQNASRITKEDRVIAEDIEYQCDMSFDNVCLSELNDIEEKLEINVHVFGCNKDFKGKKIIRKCQKTFDKDLNLLLIDEINHYILIKDINKFMSDNSHVEKTCRNCLNVFYSMHKYRDHEYYCKNRSSKKLIAHKKYLEFEKFEKLLSK